MNIKSCLVPVRSKSVIDSVVCSYCCGELFFNQKFSSVRVSVSV